MSSLEIGSSSLKWGTEKISPGIKELLIGDFIHMTFHYFTSSQSALILHASL